MHPAVRGQKDMDQQEFYTLETGIACPPEEDLTRQEDKEATDINKMLTRFGVNVNHRQPVFGAQDFDLDLQQALSAIAQAKEAHRGLPDDLRKKYRTWKDLLNAIDTGRLTISLDKEDANARTEPAQPPNPGADTPNA